MADGAEKDPGQEAATNAASTFAEGFADVAKGASSAAAIAGESSQANEALAVIAQLLANVGAVPLSRLPETPAFQELDVLSARSGPLVKGCAFSYVKQE